MANPSPSFSASALVLALKLVLATLTLKPSFSANALACGCHRKLTNQAPGMNLSSTYIVIHVYRLIISESSHRRYLGKPNHADFWVSKTSCRNAVVVQNIVSSSDLLNNCEEAINERLKSQVKFVSSSTWNQIRWMQPYPKCLEHLLHAPTSSCRWHHRYNTGWESVSNRKAMSVNSFQHHPFFDRTHYRLDYI